MKQSTHYYSDFAMKHRTAFRPHFKYGETLGKRKGAWRNVGEHCLVAGVFAELLAEAMQLPTESVYRATHAAILHDWNKKHETLLRNQYTSSSELRQRLEQLRIADQQKLLDLGYSSEVVHLTGANIPVDKAGPQTDEEKIVWYVDAMLTDTQPTRIHHRFEALESHHIRGPANLEFSQSFENQYGSSLYSLQRDLGDTIGTYLAKRIGYHGLVDDLPSALAERLRERIANYT